MHPTLRQRQEQQLHGATKPKRFPAWVNCSPRNQLNVNVFPLLSYSHCWRIVSGNHPEFEATPTTTAILRHVHPPLPSLLTWIGFNTKALRRSEIELAIFRRRNWKFTSDESDSQCKLSVPIELLINIFNFING